MDDLAAAHQWPKMPFDGSSTGQYFTSEDGSVKVAAVMGSLDPAPLMKVKQAMADYEWNDGDFLLATYPKNGTHYVWEIMMMLLRGSADYIQESKAVCMMDMFPVTMSHETMPYPRVLNTHYRFDVLPSKFTNRRSVLVLRNPKDTAVSFFHHTKNLMGSIHGKDAGKTIGDLNFSSFLRIFLFNKDQPYGRYFEYVELMWNLAKDNPNFLILHFEDVKRDPATAIHNVNKFMGTNRSSELVDEIADRTNFAKMKEGKMESSKRIVEQFTKMGLADFQGKESKGPPVTHAIYRKGEIGDWKNHLTVADNALFDEFLDRWEAGKHIPFRY